jgi:hypothetical protein
VRVPVRTGVASGTRFSHAFNVPQLQVGTLEERLAVNALEDFVARDDFTPATTSPKNTAPESLRIPGRFAFVEIAASSRGKSQR